MNSWGSPDDVIFRARRMLASDANLAVPGKYWGKSLPQERLQACDITTYGAFTMRKTLMACGSWGVSIAAKSLQSN
jgi:hypothetical protein